MSGLVSTTGRPGSRDVVRQRELYKYFTPPEGSVANAAAASRFSAPDSVLTAQVQLAAWRLNCQRAMLTLIDRDQQYFIAESTKTLDLGGSGMSELEEDELWLGLGCTIVPKEGRLCNYTITQVPPVEGGPAYFEVSDLLSDSRFKNLPFVCDGPRFRYYCGVPLRTRKGVNIGSIFVLDNRVKEPASVLHREVLSAIADNCMAHLEMIREKEGNTRTLKMNMCLSAFVDPEQHVASRRERRANIKAQDLQRTASKASSKAEDRGASKTSSKRPDKTRGEAGSIRSRRSDLAPRSSEDSSASDSETNQDPHRVDEDEHLDTFQRAAELLRSSLSLEGGGGVVFMETNQSYQLNHAEDSSSDESQSRPGAGRRDSVGHATVKSTSSWGIRAQRKSMPTENMESRPAGILASSLSAANTSTSETETSAASFTPLAVSDINKLVKRHPRGKLFSFDGENTTSSDSSDEEQHKPMQRPPLPKAKRTKATKEETALLLKHFPDARQLIFVPLWNSSTARWCACFFFNTSEYRYLEKEPDFLHSIAFSNCIMTEISRIATATADQQKSDFIGSVSHELRSPLHGILASCEFLSETKCDSFQKSLIDTADACARTLLDTLNMVLDYSRINHFERNLSKARKLRKDSSTAIIAGQTPGLAPLLNIYGDVDLAVITEEVVEGVASGQTFKDSLSMVDTADIPAAPPVQINRQGSTTTLQKGQVQIILDITAREWTFVTQPGAFRRIVMNLFGNALKYTKRGFIRVKLETKEGANGLIMDGSRQPTESHSVVLTITDSGSGMSPEFMRTKLFTPFSQESALNPGTGLGLSLVRSIVNMLNGDINIQSALDVGTEVRVTLPMLKGSPSASINSSTPSSSGSSIERAKDNSLAIVQKLSEGRSVAVFQSNLNEKSDSEKHAAQMLYSAARHYLRDWFNFSLKDWSKQDPTDVLIINENDLEVLINKDADFINGTSQSKVLVLCNTASHQATRQMLGGLDRAETLSHPFGPYKLAKSLLVCLEQLPTATSPTIVGQPAPGGAERALEPVDEVTEAVQHVKLGYPDAETPGLPIMQQGDTLGNEQSVGAQMALDTATSKSSCSDTSQPNSEFPFPNLSAVVSPAVSPAIGPNGRPPLAERRTISATRHEMSYFENARAPTAMSSAGAVTVQPVQSAEESSKTSSRPPRLLLVDDNPVNLRLLDTFMRKRKYKSVALAEDGSQAVAGFTSMINANPPAPPDIVFMDISMPIMNGFQATRRIREVEAEARAKLPPMETPASALIIALTGLASSRDQSEAFTSGFDLYLTKPVSMREVGRLLTNWEANGGAATVGVPHGPVTAGEGEN